MLHHRNGACPAFGSCHLRLRPALLERTTLIFGDSVWQRTEVAVADVLEPVLAPPLECDWFTLSATPTMTRSLEDYVEAQVHGPLVLDTDVEAVVIDPAFSGTATGKLLLAVAERHGFAAESRPGRVLPLAGVPLEAPADVSEPRL